MDVNVAVVIKDSIVKRDIIYSPFFVPGDGNMKLQFFHVEDLCRIQNG